MHDKDIRPLLRATIRDAHQDAILFEELPLCRTARADLAAVNSSLWGYEIKSEHDTLNRLPTQIGFYERIFDYSFVVTAKRHLSYVRKMVPAHWGLILVSGNNQEPSLHQIRKPRKNLNICVESLIRLLWRSEGIRILREHDVPVAHSTLVYKVWDLLAALPRKQLLLAIRGALKERDQSESDLPRRSCDDSCPTAATVVPPLDQYSVVPLR